VPPSSPAPPLQGDDGDTIFGAVLKPGPVEFPGPRWQRVSQSAKDLIARLLEKDPALRIQSHEVLTHPWMTLYAPAPTPRCRQASGLSCESLQPPTSSAQHGAPSPPPSDLSATCCAPHPQLPSPLSLAPSSAPQGSPGVSQTFDSAHGFGADMTTESMHGILSFPAESTRSVFMRAPSARVFATPGDVRTRVQVQSFIDTFKHRVEGHYTELMKAAGPDPAAAAWGRVCTGLAALEVYLNFSSPTGPFFLGSAPSLAEAVTAPTLFRMAATVRGMRACVFYGLT